MGEILRIYDKLDSEFRYEREQKLMLGVLCRPIVHIMLSSFYSFLCRQFYFVFPSFTYNYNITLLLSLDDSLVLYYNLSKCSIRGSNMPTIQIHFFRPYNLTPLPTAEGIPSKGGGMEG